MFCDVDYHIHSCYSDGALTPEQIVDRYVANRYHTIAVTDHDHIEGSERAVLYAMQRPIRVIPGIELTTMDEAQNVLHILGYHIHYDDPDLRDVLRRISLWRARRNDRLLAVLRSMGYEITVDELFEVNDGHFVGKPTIAEVMRRKGYVSSIDEAFHTVFRTDPVRAVPKQMLPTRDAIETIHGAGGVAVFAHPMEVRRHGEAMPDFLQRLDTVIRRLIQQGVDGIECYHPSASLDQAERLRTIARTCDLIVTKGSDFHSDQTRRDYEN